MANERYFERWAYRSFLSSISPQEGTALLALGAARSYTRGEVLMWIGDSSSDVFLITEGCVKVFGDTPEGNQVLLSLRVAGDLVGELAFLDGKPRSATARAADQVSARQVPAASMHRYLSDNPAVAEALQTAVAAKLREAAGDRLDFNNGDPVASRLARAIHKLGTWYGADVDEGVLVAVPLSQADLSALIGTTEQSVRRSLMALREDGLVQVHYRRLVITDMRRLEKLT